jgi:ribonucleotide reductase alpha subunit
MFNGIIAGNCTEIVQFTDKNNIAVCSLGSLILPSFMKDGVFDYDLLYKSTQELTENMNRVLDTSFYPVEKARRCSLEQRAVGIGQIGL